MDGQTDEEHLTHWEFDRRARDLGARLQELGAAGERVLVLFPPGLEFIAAAFGVSRRTAGHTGRRTTIRV